MKKIYFNAAILLALIFSGCGTKREYYEPENIEANIIYTGHLPSTIVSTNRYGATLKNRQIITQDGLSDMVLDEGFSFISKYDNKIISANDSGLLRVVDLEGNKLYERTFSHTVASASIENEKLAVVDARNTLYLVNMSNDSIYFTNSQDQVHAVDSRIAAPYFLNSLVVFPTLDGKIFIVDKSNGRPIRDFVVSSELFFNNIIYLGVVQGRLLAATAHRAICISPSKTSYLNENIKDILAFDDTIIVLTQDGTALSLDLDLKILKRKQFKFAVFLSLINDQEIYMIERNGHLIVTDKHFNTTKVYELPDKIDELLYMANDTIYYDDRLIKLHEDQ